MEIARLLRIRCSGIVGYIYFVHPLLFQMSDFRFVVPVLALLVMITVGFGSAVLGRENVAKIT